MVSLVPVDSVCCIPAFRARREAVLQSEIGLRVPVATLRCHTARLQQDIRAFIKMFHGLDFDCPHRIGCFHLDDSLRAFPERSLASELGRAFEFRRCSILDARWSASQ
jgi:hypothetical protein